MPRNAAAAVAQVVVSGVLLFLLYRYLLGAVGVERFGTWSLVLATASAARVTELGISGSVVKFVAKHLAHGDARRAGLAVQTGILALGVFVGALLLASWLPLGSLLGRLLPPEALPEAMALLPWALLSLWITTLGGIALSALDACQRTDLRASFSVLNSLLYLLLAMLAVPRHGLLGLAWIQAALSMLLAVLAWVFLRRELGGLPAVPRRWGSVEFREMLRYGVNLQIGTVMQLLYDPVTKGLLAKFGGLAMVGYYEMASRMIMQLRGLMVAPNQVAVPVIAQLEETDRAGVMAFYRDNCRVHGYLALPFYAGIVATIPGISQIWIGRLEPIFVLFSLLLTAGWFLNGFINPAYFANLGIGRLRWNTVSHAAIGVLNVALGVLMGFAWGGPGVVVGWVLALVLGSGIVLLAFHREHRLPLTDAMPADGAVLALASLAGIAVAWILYAQLAGAVSGITVLLASALAYASVIFVPAWLHPMRPRLTGLLRSVRPI